MAKVKKTTVKKRNTTKNVISADATAFIAMAKDDVTKRDRYGYRKKIGEKWIICGTDLHRSAELARACGCADNDPENVAVLEVKVIAMHKAKLVFSKEDKIEIQYNDK